jgi:hypothetical protein
VQPCVAVCSLLGHSKIVVEADSPNLIRAIQSVELDLAPEGVIYREIRSFIRLNFISISFAFQPRECNKVAHALAALGASADEPETIWLGDLPIPVSVIVDSESAAVN